MSFNSIQSNQKWVCETESTIAYVRISMSMWKGLVVCNFWMVDWLAAILPVGVLFVDSFVWCLMKIRGVKIKKSGLNHSKRGVCVCVDHFIFIVSMFAWNVSIIISNQTENTGGLESNIRNCGRQTDRIASDFIHICELI